MTPVPSRPAARPAPRTRRLAALVAAVAAVLAAAFSPAQAATAVPRFSHVFLIVMENREYGSIVGNSNAPYINSLIRRYGLAGAYTAVAHPSEPNYFALWSGSTHGVANDGNYTFTSGATLATQLTAAGRGWHVAAQDVPLGCYKGTSAYGGEDGAGWYVRRHEPAISWTSVSASSTQCAHITDFSHFSPGSGSFWLIVPNLCNDMHDCSTAHGDAFLKAFLPRILNSAVFSSSLVLITWDEGTTAYGGGGHVATLVISPLAKAGYRSATAHNHYSLLRTIERAFGLGCIGDACDANDLRELFN